MRPLEESPYRVRLQPITASVGYSPSRDPSTAWPGLSRGHRTSSSSFHEYVCSVTPIFLTASTTVLPRPTSTSTSRSIGDDLLGQFFLSAWHGMPSFGFDTTRLSLWKWCRLRGAGHCDHNKRLAEAEKEARGDRIGLWQELNPVAPWDWRASGRLKGPANKHRK